MDRAPELADPTRSLAAGQARGKKRRREETAGKGGTSSDPAVDPSLAGLRTGPDGAQADTEGASLKQGAPAQSVKKRKKHPTHRQLASDVSPRQDQAQTEQQDCQSPRAPDSTHRKRKKKKKAHNAEAVAQGTETAVGNESDRHQLWATSVSNASNMKHGSRLPNSRNVEAPSEAAERIDISKDLRKSSHAAAPAAAAAALHVDEAVPQPQVACDVEPPQSAAEQFPDAAIEAQDLDQDLADAAGTVLAPQHF